MEIQIGCDGGSLAISSEEINGLFFYKLETWEQFKQSSNKSSMFINLNDCWKSLTFRYPKWYQLYLIQISTQMIDIVKTDYILAPDKNEYTIDSWLVQLTGRGIGF